MNPIDPSQNIPEVRSVLRGHGDNFRGILEKTNDGIAVVLLDGTIRFLNLAASRLLGLPANKTAEWPFALPAISGETSEIDVELENGGTRVVEIRVEDTEWEGQPALLVLLRGLCERRRLEEQVRSQSEALADAERRMDEFLAMLAHELRNPLAPIFTALQVMRLRRDDLELFERMREMIERQASGLSRLIDDLLDVSRITRGKIRLRLEIVDLRSVIERAIETTRPLFESRAQTLKICVLDDLFDVHGDPLRLEQTIVNLLNNASKYSDEKSTIRLDCRREGPEVLVLISDDGIGMAPEILPRIFDLFVQADETLDRSQGGLGIGLTMAQGLANLHGGSVEGRSAGPDRGSEFTLRLPLVESHRPSGEEPTSETIAIEKIARKVLVVDDNLQAAESLMLILRLWGHDARMVHNGNDALEAVTEFQPEILLLDIGLPGMDGCEVSRRLRSMQAMSDLLMIAVTGYGREEDRQRTRTAGIDVHLVKPIDLEELERYVSAPCRMRRAQTPTTRVS